MPIPTTRQSELLGYFGTTDRPTEAQFGLLINTMFDIYNETLATAKAAVIAASPFKFFVIATRSGTTTVIWNISSATPAQNVSLVETANSGTAVKITFATPMSSLAYGVFPSSGFAGAWGVWMIVNKSTTSITLQMVNDNNNGVTLTNGSYAFFGV